MRGIPSGPLKRKKGGGRESGRGAREASRVVQATAENTPSSAANPATCPKRAYRDRAGHLRCPMCDSFVVDGQCIEEACSWGKE